MKRVDFDPTGERNIQNRGKSGYEPISWDEALDEVAGRFKKAAKKHGPETVWPYDFAGTMGLLQRDSIMRLRNAMKYSQMDWKTLSTINPPNLAVGSTL